jgi:site-specific recombinase XerD
MAEADLPLTSLQALLGHKSVRTTQLYVHLSNTHLQAEYNQAMSKKMVPEAVDNQVQCRNQTHIPYPKSVNWHGYLSGLPIWLSDLIRDFCTCHVHAHDPIQQTRNRLGQLSQVFRWIATEHNLSSLSDVTPRLWFAYLAMRQESGIQPSSLNTALRSLLAFLKYTKESGYSICERMLEVRPLKTGELLPRDFSEMQLEILLKQANLPDQAWILLMAHSGLRTCEIRALRWQDVDLKHQTIRIDESKGLRSRVVFMSRSAIQVLKQLSQPSEYVFTHHNQPLGNRYCQSRLTTLGKKCGFHVTPHRLRHSCATMLLNSGMSIFAVQAILGHKYVDRTLRYAQTSDSTIATNYQQAMKRVQKKGNT